MLYAFGKFIAWIYCGLFFRISVKGLENVPKTGGFLLCSNHASANDPLILGAVLSRHIVFIAKKELFRRKIAAAVLRRLNVIPIDRGSADMAAFGAGIAALKSGKVLGVFIQGGRMKDLEAGAKAGAALFASKTGAPVIPVCVSANYRLFSRVYVNIGKPMPLDGYEGKLKTAQLNELTERIIGAVKALRISLSDGAR
jgi:1-acyl-sn-glycerol-3-phosphate acyltransferase